MLKQTSLLPALLALLFFAGTSLSAQDRVESLREIDEVTGVVAGRLDQRLRSLGEGGQLKIALGRFTTEGEDTPLGDLFRSNMMSALANVERRPYLIIDAAPGAQGQADYLFSGELLDVTSAVRIVVKLVRVSDSSLAGTWTADIEKTPWIAGLIERAGSSGARRDQYETDSEESPIPAEIGGPWLSRTIHNSEDRDYFLIVSPQRAMLTAETSGSMDTMMELYSEGSRIQSDDDGGEGENSRITFTAEAGRRYVAVVRGYGTHTGAYRFHVTTETIPDEASEPNDSRDRATPLALGDAGFRAFLTSGDQDWYQGEVPAGGALITVHTESDIDTILTLYDAGGNRLAEDDDSGSGGNARVTANLPEGRFYVRATLYRDGSSQGPYTIIARMREPTAQDAYEPDNQLSQAKDIEPGQSQTRNFTDARDVDWVRLRIIRAGYYAIRAQGSGLDTYLELLDASESSLAEDDDGGEGWDAYLSADLRPGTYYIKVSCLDQEPEGNYVLSVTEEQR